MSEVELLTSRVSGLEPDAAFWANVVIVLTGLTAFVAALYFVATVISNRKTGALSAAQSELLAAKDRQSAIEQHERDERIAAADTRAAEAGAEASKANARAAEANEKTAELNARAAQAEAQVFRLKAPRANLFNSDAFKQALVGAPIVPDLVEIWFKPDDDEAQLFAFSIAAALRNAGWNATLPAAIPSGFVDSSVKHLPDDVLRNIPMPTRIGAGLSGITLVTQHLDENPLIDQTSPWSFLRKAFGAGLPGVMSIIASPDLPTNMLRVVVLSKSLP